MRNLTIRETEKGTDVVIDGVKLEGLYAITIKKQPGSPIEIEFSGAISSEVQIDS